MDTAHELRRKVARDLAEKTDNEIATALSSVSAGNILTVDDIRNRACVRNYPDGRQVITLDGVEILELWPMTFETLEENGAHTTKVTRQTRRLI